jgi:arylsulfatase A-like enzyme
MTRAGSPARDPWKGLIAAAVVVTAVRAAVLAFRDGYAASGLTGLAARSGARDFLEGLLPCAAVALAAWATSPWWRRSAPRVVAMALGLAGLAGLFVAGRLPSVPMQGPGFRLMRAPTIYGIAGGVAVVVAAWTVLGARMRPRALWAAAGGALALIAAALVVLGVGGRGRAQQTGGAAPPAVRNVILISLDTTRADRLGLYGARDGITPEIDRFFAQGSVRFEQVFAPQPWTLTSHLTLLTSLHPTVHGVNKERTLAPGVPTLARLLRERGWITFALVDSVPWMEPRFGLDRGFDVYRRTRAAANARQARLEALLDDLQHERFFLFLHYYDAHSDRDGIPYRCGPEDAAAFAGWYRGDFDGTNAAGESGTDLLWKMNHRGETLPEEDLRYVASLYDAGLRTLDRTLGELFRGLERRGILEDTVVVLTADHGEEFQEHGRMWHGQSVYGEMMHVPLVIRWPAGLDTGKVIEEPVQLVDVMPTLLDLSRLEHPAGMQGHSLLPLMKPASNGDGWARRPVILEKQPQGEPEHPGSTEAYGIIDGPWKLVHNKVYPPGRPEFELYEFPKDRLDSRNVASAHPEVVQRLAKLLGGWHAMATAARLKPDAETGKALSAEELQRLRSLGYVR